MIVVLAISRQFLMADAAPGWIVESKYNAFGYSTQTVAIAGQVLHDAVAITAGGGHGLALKSDGTVVGWGFNFYEQATVPSNLKKVEAIAAGGNFSLALKRDGTVVVWGDNRDYQTNVPADLNHVVAIAAEETHALALKKDGTVVNWGSPAEVPMGLSNVVAIAATPSFYGDDLALKNDGTVIAWCIRNSLIDPSEKLNDVVSISAGENHNLALKRDGTVFGWGDNSGGQVAGIPTVQRPYKASGMVTIGGQVLTNVIAIAAGNEFSLALKNDGTIIAWGRFGLQPASVPVGLSNVVAIAAGERSWLAITTNSAVAEKFRQK